MHKGNQGPEHIISHAPLSLLIPVIVWFAVYKYDLEARAMNVNRDRVLRQPKFHPN